MKNEVEKFDEKYEKPSANMYQRLVPGVLQLKSYMQHKHIPSIFLPLSNEMCELCFSNWWILFIIFRANTVLNKS